MDLNLNRQPDVSPGKWVYLERIATGDVWSNGKPHRSPDKQGKGNSLTEKLEELLKTEFILSASVTIGHESSPFWPPDFILNEVSVD